MRKYDHAYMVNAFKEQGCELLEKEYKNTRTSMSYRCQCGKKSSLKYRCSCGGIDEVYWFKFIDGQRCRNCLPERRLKAISTFTKEESNQRKLFGKKCYSLVNITLKSTGKSKNSKSYLLLGYTPHELREHVTQHTNW